MWLIEHNFSTSDLPYYVRRVDRETFQEVYNPEFASQFKTEKDAAEWVNTYSPMQKYSEVVKLEDALQRYKKFVSGGTVRRTLACINTSMSRPYAGEPLKEVIDWWEYQRKHDGEIKFEHYQTWPKLYQLSKHLWDVSGYHSRDYSELYITFEIFTSRQGNFKEFSEELNMVMDKVTYKDEDGYLIFPVFDHFLSEHGNSVSLQIHPETGRARIGGRYYWEEGDSDSLEDAFNYMRRERYYE